MKKLIFMLFILSACAHNKDSMAKLSELEYSQLKLNTLEINNAETKYNEYVNPRRAKLKEIGENACKRIGLLPTNMDKCYIDLDTKSITKRDPLPAQALKTSK